MQACDKRKVQSHLQQRNSADEELMLNEVQAQLQCAQKKRGLELYQGVHNTYYDRVTVQCRCVATLSIVQKKRSRT